MVVDAVLACWLTGSLLRFLVAQLCLPSSSPPLCPSIMLSVSLFCLPCVVVPALLLALQFVFNKNILYCKDLVFWLFPAMKEAEAKAKQAEAAQEAEAARKKAEFFSQGSDKATPATPEDADSHAEGQQKNEQAAGGKRKDASSYSEVVAAEPEAASKGDSKKGN